MNRRSALHITLEMIVIIGFLTLGVTISTYIFQGVPFDRIFIGSVILSTGVLETADYFTWKYVTRRRSVQSLIAAILSIALGLVIMVFKEKMDSKLMCVLWGSLSIAFAVATIVTGAINLVYQPLLNVVKIILSIIKIVFSILLIVRTSNIIQSYMLFLAIALIVESFTLLIEFIIHRYQRI